ncbi:MAG: hypothetical protein NVS2B9_18680 [Myxococcales bacterium]
MRKGTQAKQPARRPRVPTAPAQAASRRAEAAAPGGAGAAGFAQRAESVLRENGGRMTGSRRALLELIAAGPRPLSPRELHRELVRRGAAMGLVSV